ncbi:MAG: hypothetical protein JST89_05810 [Cyanobacteria bacterium SZAS-4]|nr:hypothetical protein [Cyanobacteria bacterium SZAS-4]
MQLKKTMTIFLTAASLAPAMVPAALADSCSTKVIRTSYERISPRTVKETKIYAKTRLISRAQPRHIVRRTAYLAPRTHTVTTTRTTMFVPLTSYMTPVMVKPLVVAPSSTIVRTATIQPTETTVVRTQSFIVPAGNLSAPNIMSAPVLSGTNMIAAPGETVVFKEKHGKLKEIGTLKPVVWY